MKPRNLILIALAIIPMISCYAMPTVRQMGGQAAATNAPTPSPTMTSAATVQPDSGAGGQDEKPTPHIPDYDHTPFWDGTPPSPYTPEAQ